MPPPESPCATPSPPEKLHNRKACNRFSLPCDFQAGRAWRRAIPYTLKTHNTCVYVYVCLSASVSVSVSVNNIYVIYTRASAGVHRESSTHSDFTSAVKAMVDLDDVISDTRGTLTPILPKKPYPIFRVPPPAAAAGLGGGYSGPTLRMAACHDGAAPSSLGILGVPLGLQAHTSSAVIAPPTAESNADTHGERERARERDAMDGLCPVTEAATTRIETDLEGGLMEDELEDALTGSGRERDVNGEEMEDELRDDLPLRGDSGGSSAGEPGAPGGGRRSSGWRWGWWARGSLDEPLLDQEAFDALVLGEALDAPIGCVGGEGE